MLTAGNDRQFSALCEVLGCPELAADPRYSGNAGRIENRVELNALLNARFGTRSVAYWLDRLEAAEVPAGPVNDLGQVFSGPQVEARNLVIHAEHPAAGDIRLVGNPIHYSRTPLGDFTAPPMVGQHTREILSDVLGYGEDRMEAYVAGLGKAP